MHVLAADPTAVAWDARVLDRHSLPHFMQGSTWAAARAGAAWSAHRLEFADSDRYPFQAFEREAAGFGVLRHLPRVSGIRPADVAGLTDELHRLGGAFASKVEVYQPRDPDLESAFEASGWRPCRASQYRFGVTVDVVPDEEAMLASLRKRARYEVRLAERAGVLVERVPLVGADRDVMHELVRETESRSGAFFRPPAYLDQVWNTYLAGDHGRAYFARYDGAVVAAAFVTMFGRTAWYKDGGSRRDTPHVPASRLLQWEIIRDLASTGITRYDLGHVPPPDEADAPGRGILTFKSAFAPQIIEYLPAYQLAHDPQAEQWRTGEGAFIAAHLAATGDYWY